VRELTDLTAKRASTEDDRQLLRDEVTSNAAPVILRLLLAEHRFTSIPLSFASHDSMASHS
jgi:hypothetical protein